MIWVSGKSRFIGIFGFFSCKFVLGQIFFFFFFLGANLSLGLIHGCVFLLKFENFSLSC